MIYIHIPFCKQKCIYCDFYSNTNFYNKERYIEALCTELEQRKNYISGDIKTIYLGGGTPSLLSDIDLKKIFQSISNNYILDSLHEVTIECNPDDINDDFLNSISSLPINRISIGIQSFNDDELKWLNRRHTSQQALLAIEKCRQYGYNNISIDLMFALPIQTLESWGKSIKTAMTLDVEHISCYSLMYEESSKLTKLYNDGKIVPVDENIAEEMFNILCTYTSNNGYEQYEISNFAKKGKQSIHNSAYWKHLPYIGVGAAAHSFNGISRRENIADIEKYIDNVEEESEKYFEEEIIDDDMLFNEVIFTALRTKEGVDLEYIKNRFGDKYIDYILKNAQIFIAEGTMIISSNHLSLTHKGIYISDSIMSEFMIVERD